MKDRENMCAPGKMFLAHTMHLLTSMQTHALKSGMFSLTGLSYRP